MDRAIAYVLLGRIWNTSAGALTLYMIVRFLHPDEQGFYFTFNSLLGLQIFFELGFSYTLMQCVSHEKAHLAWNADGTVQGDEHAKHRLAELLRVALKWYGGAAGLFFLLVLPAGLIFFRGAGAVHADVSWRWPWVWLMIAESLMLFVSPFFVFLEGTGMVAQIALVRLSVSVFSSVALWLVLWQGGALMANPVVTTVGCAISTLWLVTRRSRFFHDLLRTRTEKAIMNWRTEVWPFQWRITITWLSWYLVSQWATPVLFRYRGAVVAGQMGLSLSVVLAAQAVGMAWVSTKAPQFGVYVARNEFGNLDQLFFKTLKQAMSLMAVIGGGLVLGVLALNALPNPYGRRLLGPLPFCFLVARMLVDLAVYFMGVYLRAHKREPLLVLSIISAIAGGGSTYICAIYWGATGIAVSTFVVTMVGFPVVLSIFRRKRELWHARPEMVFTT